MKTIAAALKNATSSLLAYICIGILLVVGMRIAEWVIPAPSSRVLVCYAGETDAESYCLGLDELREEQKRKTESKT